MFVLPQVEHGNPDNGPDIRMCVILARARAPGKDQLRSQAKTGPDSLFVQACGGASCLDRGV